MKISNKIVPSIRKFYIEKCSMENYLVQGINEDTNTVYVITEFDGRYVGITKIDRYRYSSKDNGELVFSSQKDAEQVIEDYKNSLSVGRLDTINLLNRKVVDGKVLIKENEFSRLYLKVKAINESKYYKDTDIKVFIRNYHKGKVVERKKLINTEVVRDGILLTLGNGNI